MSNTIILQSLLANRDRLVKLLAHTYDPRERNELSRKLTIVGKAINEEKFRIATCNVVAGKRQTL